VSVKGGKALIRRLGFKKGRIVEAVVTTYNRDTTPNAAPMGVFSADKTLVLKVHKSSDTCGNILRTGGCVVNLVYDPLLFLKSALTAKGEPEVQLEDTGEAETVYAPFLKNSHAYLESKLLGTRRYLKRDRYGASEVFMFRFGVMKIEVLKKYPVGFNRGLAAAIELAINLSRGKKEGWEEQVRIMKRVLSTKEYREIISFLKQQL
jgi:hypothetical protein